MDPFYRAFEERYRGSRELIKERLEVYLPFVEPLKALYEAPEILDLGCGRGEWLDLLSCNGFQAKGVDLDEGMLSACRELNLDVCQADALDYLRGMEADSLSVISAFHVVEHIPFEVLRQLVDEAHRVLKQGGLLIMETPNSENLVIGTSDFYLDPTHQRPLPAQLLSFVAEYAGFARVKVLYLHESPELVKTQRTNLFNVINGVSPDYAIVAQKKATAEVFSILDESFNRSFGISLHTLSGRYDQQAELRAAQIENRTAQVENRTAQVEDRTSQVEDRTAQGEDRTAQVENRIAQVEGRTAQVEDRTAQVENRAAQAEDRIAQNENRATQAEARAADAQMVIQNLLMSSSWRITAPLRHITLQFLRFNAAIREGRIISGINRRINSMRYILRKPALSKVQSQSELSQSRVQSQSELSHRAARIYSDLQKAIATRKN